MKPKKWIAVLGTRPEAIKLAPILLASQQYKQIELLACNSGQHLQICQESLGHFGLMPDLICNAFEDSGLNALHTHCFQELSLLFEREKPAGILVQGDTSTAYTAALAAFYQQIPIAHIEAGLRTYDTQNPYPEEFHRHSISQIAQWHFCPTEQNKKNLIQENIKQHIFVVGNPVIDAVKYTLAQKQQTENKILRSLLIENKPFIFVSMHRRENWHTLEFFCQQILNIARDYRILFTLHPNPSLQYKIKEILAEKENIHLVTALQYSDCLAALNAAHCVLSDSGGFQEECSYLQTPLLIYRKTTERPETLSDQSYIINPETQNLLERVKTISMKREHKNTPKACPFGDGEAAARICKILFDSAV